MRRNKMERDITIKLTDENGKKIKGPLEHSFKLTTGEERSLSQGINQSAFPVITAMIDYIEAIRVADPTDNDYKQYSIVLQIGTQ